MTHTAYPLFEVTISSFRLSQNGLQPLGTPSFDEWLACGHFIRNVEQAVQFWIGDWLLYGEKTYGKTQYEQAVQETGLDYQTLRIYKYVASAIPVSLRRNKVSFHHYKEVANLTPDTQAHLLQKAEAEGWPLIKLKQEKNRLNLELARPSSQVFDPGLLFGDCTRLLPRVPDASVDMVLTAPDYETTSLAHLEKALVLAYQKLKENSHVYMFTSWKTYPALFPLMQKYFTVKNLLVWEKNVPPSCEKTAYTHVYDFIFFAHKGRRHLNGRRDASVLQFDAPAFTHPTEKPLPLLEYLINKSTLPGEVVCDPLMGTGSTCVAAKNTGRKWIGIEIDDTYYDIAKQRLA